MLVWPISSPKMTRIFGLRPAGAEGCAGCCAWAIWTGSMALIAVAVTSDVPPSRRLLRLSVLLSVGFGASSAVVLLLVSLAIQFSIFLQKGKSFGCAH